MNALTSLPSRIYETTTATFSHLSNNLQTTAQSISQFVNTIFSSITSTFASLSSFHLGLGALAAVALVGVVYMRSGSETSNASHTADAPRKATSSDILYDSSRAVYQALQELQCKYALQHLQPETTPTGTPDPRIEQALKTVNEAHKVVIEQAKDISPEAVAFETAVADWWSKQPLQDMGSAKLKTLDQLVHSIRESVYQFSSHLDLNRADFKDMDDVPSFIALHPTLNSLDISNWDLKPGSDSIETLKAILHIRTVKHKLLIEDPIVEPVVEKKPSICQKLSTRVIAGAVMAAAATGFGWSYLPQQTVS